MFKWFKGKRSLDLKSLEYEQSLGSRVVRVGFQADVCHLTRFLERRITFTQGIELFHMASRPPCCKGRAFWCHENFHCTHVAFLMCTLVDQPPKSPPRDASCCVGLKRTYFGRFSAI